jgi:adenylosuccinate lyase
MEVDPARMLENLERSHGLVFSQPVLLALVEAGLARDEAYRIVQRNAMAAWEQGKSFRTLLEGDPDVTVGAEALDEAFNLARAVRHAGRVFDHLEEIE